MPRPFEIAVLLATVASTSPSIGAAAPRLRLLSNIGAQAPTPEWKFARLGQSVTLRANLEPPVSGTRFEWFKLEATVGSVDNTQPSFHFEPIAYEAVEMAGCRGSPTCPAEVTPTRLPAPAIAGTGTMAFQVVAILPEGGRLATPGIEAVRYGGLTPAVHRVTFRRDDTYLGYLTELFNTPYIFGSAGPDGRNQTDLLIGSDCADLAVYGRRRLGHPAKYTSSYAIDAQAPEVTRTASLSEQGAAVDPKGRPVVFGQKKGQVAPGDLLHFPNSRHVAVLYEDREPKGVLDSGDLMLHTCWAPPRVEAIGENTQCVSLPWRVLRFK